MSGDETAPGGRVVDLPALVKARLILDDPDSYFTAVRAERADEVREERRRGTTDD